jgi:dTDP-4-amino-4,6-dideoxygalactose transaminase
VLESRRATFRPAANTLQEAFQRPIIISDAAHSLGARRSDRPSGSWGDFTAFSFHAVKNLTCGEGGALAWQSLPAEALPALATQSQQAQPAAADTSLPDSTAPADDALYRQLMLISLHGQSKDALAKEALGSWEYDIVAPLYKRNMTDIQAALGLSQLRRYDAILARRHEIVQLYNKLLGDLPLEILSHSGPHFRSSAHLYMLRLTGKDEGFRNALIARLATRDVASNVHYKPLPLFSAYRQLGFRAEDFPNAVQRYANQITLPLHTLLSDEDVEEIAATFIASYHELETEHGR